MAEAKSAYSATFITWVKPMPISAWCAEGVNRTHSALMSAGMLTRLAMPIMLWLADALWLLSLMCLDSQMMAKAPHSQKPSVDVMHIAPSMKKLGVRRAVEGRSGLHSGVKAARVRAPNKAVLPAVVSMLGVKSVTMAAVASPPPATVRGRFDHLMFTSHKRKRSPLLRMVRTAFRSVTPAVLTDLSITDNGSVIR